MNTEKRVVLFEGYPWFELEDTFMGQNRILKMAFKRKNRGAFSAYIPIPTWINSKRIGKYRLVLELVKKGE